MAFTRRRRFPMRRRRRTAETYTLKECRECFNVYGAMPCTAPRTDVIPVLTMSTARIPGVDTTQLTTPSQRAITFQGARFQSLWFHDPNTTQDCTNANPSQAPNATTMVFILTIWECLMVLPLLQGSTATPAYLPNLTFPSLQSGDVADRVLWKRLTHLFVQGVHSLAGAGLSFVYNPDTSARYNTEFPVRVKTKVRLDDRHGLFLVRNFVHDIFLPFSPEALCGLVDCDNCDINNSEPVCGSIPIENDLWMKLYYKVS